MSKSEYKPTKWAWFFSVVIAAGVGAAAVDLVKFVYKKATTKEFQIELVDVWCRDAKCTFTVANNSDEDGVLTAFTFDGARFEEFYTTNPVGYVNMAKLKEPAASSVVYLPKKSFADVVVGDKPARNPKEKVCLIGTQKSWCFSGKELKDIIYKQELVGK
ncbi:hypothetical protein [Photobacterium carnosum]|uniref:hypothetical protein n=1 Tax=Photobacterium carnosum TaxID=2023717 RepID=UPI00242BD66D|nr:hypothetical protein [Photobacterium carnosum]